MTDVGLRRIFNQEHDEFRESCRAFYASEVQPPRDRQSETLPPVVGGRRSAERRAERQIGRR